MINNLLKINPTILALIGSTFTFLITSLGAGTVFFLKKINKNILDAMLSISAGIMISASFFSLLNPAITMSNEQEKITWLVTSTSFILGGILLFCTDKIFDKKYKHKNKKKKRNILLFSSITIHNIPEGLAIGCAFGALYNNLNASTLISATVLSLGIGLQNFPEGSAVSLPLRRDGINTVKAFILGSLSAVVEPISAVIGSLLVLKITKLLPYFLCFAAGAMIYVVTKELIPESQTNKNKSIMNMFTIIGFTIMMILDLALG